MVKYGPLGKRIRKFREGKGWTQSDLADAISMSNTTISHIEVGKGRPELNTIVNIANALEVSLDSLLCDSLKVSEAAYRSEIARFLENIPGDEVRFLEEIFPIMIELYKKYFKSTKSF